MINCNFVNYEEQLFHVIRTRTTTFEDYKDVVEKNRDKIILTVMITVFYMW